MIATQSLVVQTPTVTDLEILEAIEIDLNRQLDNLQGDRKKAQIYKEKRAALTRILAFRQLVEQSFSLEGMWVTRDDGQPGAVGQITEVGKASFSALPYCWVAWWGSENPKPEQLELLRHDEFAQATPLKPGDEICILPGGGKAHKAGEVHEVQTLCANGFVLTTENKLIAPEYWRKYAERPNSKHTKKQGLGVREQELGNGTGVKEQGLGVGENTLPIPQTPTPIPSSQVPTSFQVVEISSLKWDAPTDSHEVKSLVEKIAGGWTPEPLHIAPNYAIKTPSDALIAEALVASGCSQVVVVVDDSCAKSEVRTAVLDPDDINLDLDTQPRYTENKEKVQEYAERMMAGDWDFEGKYHPLPKITQVGADYLPRDCHHRILAARIAGVNLKFQVFQEESLALARAWAASENTGHGIPYQPRDHSRRIKQVLDWLDTASEEEKKRVLDTVPAKNGKPSKGWGSPAIAAFLNLTENQARNIRYLLLDREVERKISFFGVSDRIEYRTPQGKEPIVMFGYVIPEGTLGKVVALQGHRDKGVLFLPDPGVIPGDNPSAWGHPDYFQKSDAPVVAYKAMPAPAKEGNEEEEEQGVGNGTGVRENSSPSPIPHPPSPIPHPPSPIPHPPSPIPHPPSSIPQPSSSIAPLVLTYLEPDSLVTGFEQAAKNWDEGQIEAAIKATSEASTALRRILEERTLN
jgi:hypothetical protein